MFSNIKLKKLEFFFKAKIGVEKSYFFVVISHINNQYKIDIKTYTRIQIQIIVIHRFFFISFVINQFKPILIIFRSTYATIYYKMSIVHTT